MLQSFESKQQDTAQVLFTAYQSILLKSYAATYW